MKVWMFFRYVFCCPNTGCRYDTPLKFYMGVSKNKSTPEWMVYNGKPYQNGWFGGTTIFGNTHMRDYSGCHQPPWNSPSRCRWIRPKPWRNCWKVFVSQDGRTTGPTRFFLWIRKGYLKVKMKWHRYQQVGFFLRPTGRLGKGQYKPVRSDCAMYF